MKKTRGVKNDAFELKEYLKNNNPIQASSILHMSKLKCNFESSKNSVCPLCMRANITTEHYFKGCDVTAYLAKTWETKEEDLISKDENELKRATSFIKKIEILMEPKWK